MKSIVRVNKNQLDRFRRFARATEKEIQVFLIGKVVSPELAIVEEFAYPTKYAVQTTGEVRWYEDDFIEVKTGAEERGKRIVGDLHSHPNWDAVMSPSDYKAHIGDGHRICGICSTMTTPSGQRRTRVRFWISESALPCEIEYA